MVSELWVAHGEIDLSIVHHPGSLQIGNRRLLLLEIDFCCTNQIVVVFPCVVLQIGEDREQIEEQHVGVVFGSLFPCAVRPPPGRSFARARAGFTWAGEQRVETYVCWTLRFSDWLAGHVQ